MNVGFLLPGLSLLGVALLFGLMSRPLPSRFVVRALTLVAFIAAGTVAVVVLATAAGFVLGPARRAELVGYCRLFPLHHEVGRVEGGMALFALLVMVVRVVVVLVRRRRAIRGTIGRRISIVRTSEPLAYAAPGKPGCVVVSTGLLSSLDPSERQVVFAHERAHLRQGHHRYLLVGSLANAVVPLLGPLVNRLRFATERCADEEAAVVLGDRQLVARAIAKASLTTSAFGGLVPAFGGGSVVARVDALIGAPPSRPSIWVALAVVGAGSLAAIGAGTVQLHHLWVLVDHICHG